MAHCVDFWRKWKKEPNFCGLGKKSAKSFDKYIKFVEEFSREYNIPENIVYQNVPHSAVGFLLRFDQKSDMREKGKQEIFNVLSSKRSVTGTYMKCALGVAPPTAPLATSPVVAAISEIPKEVFDSTRLTDRIRLINAALTTGQHKILLEIMESEEVDNEYEALSKALIWAKERIG